MPSDASVYFEGLSSILWLGMRRRLRGRLSWLERCLIESELFAGRVLGCDRGVGAAVRLRILLAPFCDNSAMRASDKLMAMGRILHVVKKRFGGQ